MTSIVTQSPGSEQRADCGFPGADVVYQDPTELGAACAALTEIIAYFRSMGFDIAPQFSLHFVDHAIDRAPQLFSAHGYFNGPQSRVVIYRSSDAGAWELPWSAKMAGSFVGHELAQQCEPSVGQGTMTEVQLWLEDRGASPRSPH